MEKRTFLAIALAVSVLFVYQSVFVKPKPAATKNPQVVVNEEDKEKVAPSEVSEGTSNIKTTSVDFNEEKWDISSPIFDLKVTNVGGGLHNIKIQSRPLTLKDILTIKGLESAEFKSQDSKGSVFQYEDSKWRIIKTIEQKSHVTLTVKMEVIPKEMSSLDNIELILFNVDTSSLVPNAQDAMLNEYSTYDGKKVLRKGVPAKFSPKENAITVGSLQWAGFREHFSAFIIKPEFQTKQYEIKTFNEKNLGVSIVPEVKVGGSNVYNFTIFAGPQDTGLMKKEEAGFEKIVAFFHLKIFDLMGKAIYYTIPFLYKVTHNWGLSIIGISLIIYGLTYPLTVKSMVSMRKMQQMQPKIKALQERYKGEPQKLNTEIMEIYRREKINPLGGCLPFLLQMPVFIALYQVLWRSHYFQGQGFLWVKDLTQPDRAFILPFSLPFLGNELNVLPILMGIVMFAQQKVSAKNITVTDEQQAMQQKMMMYFFPFFIAFIFYHFASGLSLYFTVFYLLSTITQWKMTKPQK